MNETSYDVRFWKIETRAGVKKTTYRVHWFVDNPRSVGTPALIAGMLVACSYFGLTQGPRFAAFYRCMYYAMMRPSEVATHRRRLLPGGHRVGTSHLRRRQPRRRRGFY